MDKDERIKELEERPSYLCREIKSNQAVLPNCYKQNIHKV
jgi:hypothetical protein